LKNGDECEVHYKHVKIIPTEAVVRKNKDQSKKKAEVKDHRNTCIRADLQV
jgi:hypothetical protein